MRQSRLMSLVEAATNVGVGLLVAVATQVIVFPILGLHASLGQTSSSRWSSPASPSRGATCCGGCSRRVGEIGRGASWAHEAALRKRSDPPAVVL